MRTKPCGRAGSRIPNAALMEFLKALPVESTDTRYAAWAAAGTSASATQEQIDDMRNRVRYISACTAMHQCY